jgi:hypothetical protein
MRLFISLVCVLLCIFSKAWARLGKDEHNVESLVEEDEVFWSRTLQAVPSYPVDWAQCGASCTTDADCGTPTSSDGCFTCSVDKICLPEKATNFDWTKCGVECSTDTDCGTSTSSDGCFKCSAEKMCLPEKIADFDTSKCGEACATDADCGNSSSDSGCFKCNEYAKICI